MSVSARFREHLAGLSLGSGPILVAVSGGPDSLALLDLLAEARSSMGLTISVGHVDHGISPDSDRVAERVREVAAGYRVPFNSYQVRLGPAAGETTARAARHAALEALRAEVSARWVALGHSADDQAETVLMRLLRGSGPAGLAGMASVSGHLLRPLLPFARAELAEYLAERRIEWWDDPANRDLRHDRAWLRHEVIPALRQRLPELPRNLIVAARQAAVDRAAWDQVLDQMPELEVGWEDSGAVSVAGGRLADYDSSLALALIKALGRRVGRTIGWRDAERVLDLVTRGTSGRLVELGDGWFAELSFGRLRLGQSRADAAGATERLLDLTGHGEADWGRWRITWSEGKAPEGQQRVDDESWLVPGPVSVRAPSPGDRLRPLGGEGSRPLARCFQDARIPRSRRGTWPVLASGGQIVWIPGVCRSAVAVPEPGTEAVRVDVRYL